MKDVICDTYQNPGLAISNSTTYHKATQPDKDIVGSIGRCSVNSSFSRSVKSRPEDLIDNLNATYTSFHKSKFTNCFWNSSCRIHTKLVSFQTMKPMKTQFPSTAVLHLQSVIVAPPASQTYEVQKFFAWPTAPTAACRHLDLQCHHGILCLTVPEVLNEITFQITQLQRLVRRSLHQRLPLFAHRPESVEERNIRL